MIKLSNVHKYFFRHKRNEIHVINGTSLDLGDSGLVALLGPSGCGKTTLLNAIGGLDKIDNGQIFVNGKRITQRSAGYIDKVRNLNIGYIFQDYRLMDNMSVFDNVALVLKMIGLKDKEEIKKRVNYVLETLGIYRYRNRMAGMLSGGERQRVGIARAIVKNPSIIIADEPTGNLDSRNTLEIMNIIKSISRAKLVILVTHERDLAHFFASRVIELKDGVIISDQENQRTDDLDYRIDNKIYLKDIAEQKRLDDLSVDIYGHAEKLDLEIVVKNNNLYIKSKHKQKIEIVDDNSLIEFVDDHYKKLSREESGETKFDLESVSRKKFTPRYSSILNIWTMLIGGFKKLFDYSVLKKLLLIGFALSAMFILYAASNIVGVLTISDKDFVTVNKNYLVLSNSGNNVDEYLATEATEGLKYTLPGDSNVSFTVKYLYYYQTSNMTDTLTGSLSGLSLITQDDLILGRMPENDYELVVDKLAIEKMFNNNKLAQQVGLTDFSKMLDKEISIQGLNNFTIVGITDMESPCIYANESMFIKILWAATQNGGYYPLYGNGKYDVSVAVDKEPGYNDQTPQLADFDLIKDSYTLKKGKLPANDYEVLVNYDQRYTWKLNKTIDVKVNGHKLKVVGYYTSTEQLSQLLVTENTIKYSLIENSQNITLMPDDKTSAIAYFQGLNMNVEDTYTKALGSYKESIQEATTITLVVAGVILLISLIEIYLMIRASFLSRIKEIGTLRAIGVKKRDIRKMFLGEILAITTIASVPGYAFMIYVLSQLISLPYFSDLYSLSTLVLVGSIALIYLFNIIVGLMPVSSILRKRPAMILARTDVD